MRSTRKYSGSQLFGLPTTLSMAVALASLGYTSFGEAASDLAIEEVIVTGMRNSLLSSQNMKRTSDVIVDAVTAEDIGALPDRSAAP